MKKRFKKWLDERRPSSRTTGDKVFSIIFSLLILGGAGYAVWWAWETILEKPVPPSVNEYSQAKTCFDEVDQVIVNEYINSIEDDIDRSIEQYEWDGFVIAIESEGMIDVDKQYSDAGTFCESLDNFMTTVIDSQEIE